MLQVEVSQPPAKRAHLEEKGAIASPSVICNGEPLEDYSKMETLPPIPEPTKVCFCQCGEIYLSSGLTDHLLSICGLMIVFDAI